MKHRPASQPRVGAAALLLPLLLLLAPTACGKGDTSTTLDAVSPEEAKALMARGVTRTAASTSFQMVWRFSGHGGDRPRGTCPSTAAGPTTESYAGIDNARHVAIAGPSEHDVRILVADLRDPDGAVFVRPAPTMWGATTEWLQVRESDLFVLRESLTKNLVVPRSSEPAPGEAVDGVVDPMDYLRQLQDASTSIDDVGNESIDGTTTRHLEITIDPTRLYARTDDDPPESHRFTDGMTAAGDAWIDDEGLVRRIALELERPARSSSDGLAEIAGFTFRVELDLFAYDEPLPAAEPLPHQVTDIRGLPAQPIANDAFRCTFADDRRESDPRRPQTDCVRSAVVVGAEGVTWGEWRKDHVDKNGPRGWTTDPATCRVVVHPLPTASPSTTVPPATPPPPDLPPPPTIDRESPEFLACEAALDRLLASGSVPTGDDEIPAECRFLIGRI